MSVVDGIRDDERRQAALSIDLKATMFEVHCGDKGAAEAARLRAMIVAEPDDGHDDCDDLDLDAEASPVAAEIVSDRDSREAAEWWEEVDEANDDDGGDE